MGFNNSRYLGKGSGTQIGGSWWEGGGVGEFSGLGTLKGPWDSVELNHQCSRESCGPGEFWDESQEGFREGRFTLSILVAPGRFLGLLVRVTLTKLWKAADLRRKKETRDFAISSQPWLCPPPHPLLLPFAFLL